MNHRWEVVRRAIVEAAHYPLGPTERRPPATVEATGCRGDRPRLPPRFKARIRFFLGQRVYTLSSDAISTASPICNDLYHATASLSDFHAASPPQPTIQREPK
uniref:Uncharacterized protein n=1 Tax=Oryza rufipogon TaxID=4529 RepID=A0A0E0QPZ4_ORYRU